jgi:hypothetical protein
MRTDVGDDGYVPDPKAGGMFIHEAPVVLVMLDGMRLLRA